MNQEKNQVDTEAIYLKWLRLMKSKYGTGIYVHENREGMLYCLLEMFLEYPVDEDDVRFFKRRVQEDLITNEGKKASKNKSDPRYKWYERIAEDFIAIVNEFFDPNKGLKTEKQVVYSRSKFMLPKDEKIVAWVKEKYGESQDLIEQAHNVNSTLCLQYFTELEKRGNNE